MKIIERIRLGDRGKGSLLRYEDSSNWTFSYYQHGKEHRVSTGTAKEKGARRFAKRRLDEVSADRQGLKTLVTPSAARVTVNQLLDAYLEDLKLREVKSLYKTEKHMVAVREYLGSMRATSVTAEIVDIYISAKQKAGEVQRHHQPRYDDLGHRLPARSRAQARDRGAAHPQALRDQRAPGLLRAGADRRSDRRAA